MSSFTLDTPTSLSYLDIPLSTVLDNTGAGFVQTIVPNNQYWQPILVRIGCSNSIVDSFLPAVLHVGSPSITTAGEVQPNEALDYTWTGGADTTGVLSGTIVPPGLAIKIKWFGDSGNAGLAMFARIIGYTSNTPPTSIVPIPPGIRFSGSNPGITENSDGTVGQSININYPQFSSLVPSSLVFIDTGTLAANASFVFLPALSATEAYGIFKLGLSLDAAAQGQAIYVEDTGNNKLDFMTWESFTAAGYMGQPPIRDYGAATLSFGAGVQITNIGTAQRFLGYCTYSIFTN
jgi:hypothetical protein